MILYYFETPITSRRHWVMGCKVVTSRASFPFAWCLWWFRHRHSSYTFAETTEQNKKDVNWICNWRPHFLLERFNHEGFYKACKIFRYEFFEKLNYHKIRTLRCIFSMKAIPTLPQPVRERSAVLAPIVTDHSDKLFQWCINIRDWIKFLQ